MRLNKVSELIHNSTNFQNLGYARVSVFFQEIVDHVVSEPCPLRPLLHGVVAHQKRSVDLSVRMNSTSGLEEHKKFRV